MKIQNVAEDEQDFSCAGMANQNDSNVKTAGNERWAKVASRKIRKFFLDEETGMLPTLLYAQLKPGMSDVGAPTVCIRLDN